MATHSGAPTHVVTFEPMYQIELCIPPWEHPDRHIARSAVSWGQHMGRVFDGQDQSRARSPSWRPITRATHSRSTARARLGPGRG